MPTLAELEAQDLLGRIEVPLGPGDSIERAFFGLPEFITWLEETLPYMACDRDRASTPMEQFEALVHEFVTGGPVEYPGQVKPWGHAGGGVWYLRTTDLRIFGWFAQRDHFIAGVGMAKVRLRKQRLYGEPARRVVDLRRALPLNEPKFIPGGDPHVVLSNQARP